MYNILCLGLSDPSNASKTLIIHFQAYITAMFNAFFILSGRGLKTIKT